MRLALSCTSIVPAAVWPSARAEARSIPLPSLLVDRDHGSELTVGAGEALFETADSLVLAEMMADCHRDGIAHRKCNCVGWTCMRDIMIERRMFAMGPPQI